jgi:decaprenylphospho-beta-D-erythro-pentofuranosid-2-ulose 2-reductase
LRTGVGGFQTVLVLGGGSDIAGALVDRLRRDGPVTAVLAARTPVQDAGDGVYVPFDVLDRASHRAFVDDVFTRYGDIDLVVVAVGVLGDQERDEVDSDSAVAVIETNFVGVVSVLIPVAERMRRQGHGSIVVLSSVAAERPRRANFVYGASKAGLDAFAQGLGDALVGSGVHLLVVRPGFVHSKMTTGLKAAPFAVAPAAVADAIWDGLRSGAHTIWVPPVLRGVMAVMRHLPRSIFRMIRA